LNAVIHLLSSDLTLSRAAREETTSCFDAHTFPEQIFLSSIPMLKSITSRDNPTVKHLAALIKSAPARRRDGACLLEGEHLAQSYVQHGGRLTTLALRSAGSEAELSASHHALATSADETILLAPQIFDQLSSLATSSGVLAIAAVPTAPPIATTGFILALDAVQDPGNVGTLIRTAAAAGCTQVWLSPGCAFAWSVKTLRASQGAHFHVDLIDDVDLNVALCAFSGERWATLPRTLPGMKSSVVVRDLFDAKFAKNIALILSNEGSGLSPALYASVTNGVSIAMQNNIESLNVSTAGALALYAVVANRL
jgi:RNA methyltransferase, TrmH family